MKKLCAYLMAVLFVSCGFAFGQGLNDGPSPNPLEVTLDLSKPSLDSTVWKTYSPTIHRSTGSHQIVQGDRLELSNAEWLYLANPPSSVESVEGSFTLRDSYDIMWVMLNSAGDPSTSTSMSPDDGVQVAMGNRTGGVSLILAGPNPRKTLLDVPFNFNVGETYSFLIVDDGQNLSVTINGNEVASADYRSEPEFIDGGSNVVLQNREGWPGPHTAYIHSYKISGGAQASTFQVIEGNFTWQEAKEDAEAKGGRLAVLDTQEKIDAANSYLEEIDEWPDLWIGLTDEAKEGEWFWLNGIPLTTSYWAPTQPEAGKIWNGQPENYAIYHRGERKWHDVAYNWGAGYLLEILDQTPAAPFVAIDPLYESPTGESITLDATPTLGFPTEFTYQWCFNGFKIPANLGGTASSINIDNLQANEGTWSVSITNSEGIFEQDFEYRVYVDSDSDGLSDAYEEFVSETNFNKPDTDGDGLLDGDEVNVYSTNPNSPDTDSDGFTDLYEVETAYDPNSAESVPDALVNIMTAIEVKFNAALGATYAIEFSTDNQNWDVIEDDIVGEGGAVERLYSKQNFPTGFFRVERRDQ
ncbi:hypothetical protein OAG84_00710 [Akkermansiaceae bacterium]|nr:hypothetical protein [Akkermansiaceae bacterium]